MTGVFDAGWMALAKKRAHIKNKAPQWYVWNEIVGWNGTRRI